MKKMMKRYAVMLIALAAVLVVSCKTNDPISGTWTGTMFLENLSQHADTSSLSFTVINTYGVVTGTVTATNLGWQSVPITVGTYVAAAKSFGLTADVGGSDGELVLAGTLSGTTLSGAATTTTGKRAGTWSAEK
jgi:hypothetical protein